MASLKSKLDQNKFGFERRAAESSLCGKTHVRGFEPIIDLRDEHLPYLKKHRSHNFQT